jgi:hypothetical protein
MRSNLLTLLLFVIISICVSAQTTLHSEGELFLSSLLDTTFPFDTTHSVASLEKKPIIIDTVNMWKEWKTVQNFTFGKDRGNLPMIADLKALHPYFRDKINQLINNCRAKGIELAVVESYRTHAKQSEYFGMGRKYTRSAGGKSKHQYGLAVDVVPVIDSVAIWDDAALWRKIGVEGEKIGLRWGGRWRSPYDPAHFEWTGGGINTYQLAQGAFPSIPNPVAEHYPCVHDDLRILKKYWEAWEYEQGVIARDNRKALPGTYIQKP